MKTLILTPVFRRPEIVRIFLEGYQRLKEHADIMLVCIVSPEDPHRDYLIDMIIDHDGEVCEWSNKYLGEKKNAGLEFALDFEFDYLMELGSDNLVNPAIFRLYEPYMKKRVPFFGLNNLYVLEWATKKCLYIEKYNSQHTYGAGRMLLNSAITVHPWPDKAQEGLDTLAMKKLKEMGISETVVDVGETPYILDIKTDTNINDFVWFEPIGREVKFSDIGQYFGLPVYNDAILALQDRSVFITHVDSLVRYSGYTQKKAYDAVENLYNLHFGTRKFKNYHSFRNEKCRSEK